MSLLSPEEIAILRNSQYPQVERVNTLHLGMKDGWIVIRDWSGYLTKTRSMAIAEKLLYLESHRAGLVRELITGMDPTNLMADYERRRDVLLNRPQGGMPDFDLDLSDL